MTWTHIYNLLGKLLAFGLPILILVNIPFFEDKGILILIISLIAGILSYVYFFRTIGNYLYCRLILKMNINLAQTKKLNDALAPYPFVSMREWLPLKQLKDLSINPDEKYDMALSLIEGWKSEVKQEKLQSNNEYKNSSLPNKIFVWTFVSVLVISLITSFLNVPPSSYVIRFYCDVFETEKYPVMLIGLIPVFIFILIYFLIIKTIQFIRARN